MRTLMKVLKNLFGNNTKISASDIAIKNSNNKGMSLDNYLKKLPCMIIQMEQMPILH